MNLVSEPLGSTRRGRFLAAKPLQDNSQTRSVWLELRHLRAPRRGAIGSSAPSVRLSSSIGLQTLRVWLVSLAGFAANKGSRRVAQILLRLVANRPPWAGASGWVEGFRRASGIVNRRFRAAMNTRMPDCLWTPRNRDRSPQLPRINSQKS